MYHIVHKHFFLFVDMDAGRLYNVGYILYRYIFCKYFHLLQACCVHKMTGAIDDPYRWDTPYNKNWLSIFFL